MKDKLKFLPTIIFFGALWGIVEASIGYLLHMIPGLSVFVSGAVMFPFATILLYKAYLKTNSRMSLLYVGIVAAAIKAVDFFLPFYSPFKIINPMISIIFESLALFMVIAMLSKKDLISKFSAVLIGSFAWRVLFFAYMGVQYFTSGYSYLSGVIQYLDFFLFYAFLSSALAITFIYLDSLLIKNSKKITKFSSNNSLLAGISLVIAIVLTILL